MKHFRFLYLFPALLLMLAACKVSDSPTSGSNNDKIISTTIAGMVNDENGLPVEGASVTANGKTTTTNEYGTFMIQGINVPASRCFILTKKNGYFTGSRAETPIAGGITEFRLTMQSNTATYSVDAASGGKVSVGDASITFLPASLVTTNGTPFTGTAKVAVKFLDPSLNSFYNSFSGDMTGKRLNGSQTDLLSYGVLRVQITDGSGNELKLAVGKTATLVYPLATSMQKNAPASMPLWYFDETLGIWKEEGSAVKSGDYYSGDVSHFTDWNCDNPLNTGTIKGQVKCKSDGIAGINVTVGQRRVLTNSLGHFSCQVPIGIDFKISIDPYASSNLIVKEINVSALKNAGEEQSVDIQIESCPSYLFGSLIDCNSEPTAGMIIVTYPHGFQYQCTTSGEFKICVPSGVPLSITAIACNGKVSFPTSVGTLNVGETKYTGWLLSCQDRDKNITSYDIDFGKNVISAIVMSTDGLKVAVNGYRFSDSKGFTEIYSTVTGQKICGLYHIRGLADVVNFTDDGNEFLIQWKSDSAYVINSNDGTVIQKFFNVMNARLLPDGSSIHGFLPISDHPSRNSFYSMKDGSKIRDFSFKMTGDWEMQGVTSWGKMVITCISALTLVVWDVETDKLAYNRNFSPFLTSRSDLNSPRRRLSPDLSVFSILETDSTFFSINFYSTLSGNRLNNTSLKYLENKTIGPNHFLVGDRSISNDLTFMIQRFNQNRNPLQPEIYSITDMKILKVLPMRFATERISLSTYSANSNYIASVINNNAYPKADSNVSVRIWKVK